MNSCSCTSRRPSEAGKDCEFPRLSTNSSSAIAASHSVALDISLRPFRSVRSERCCWFCGGSEVGLSNRYSFFWLRPSRGSDVKVAVKIDNRAKPKIKHSLAGLVSSRLKVVGSNAIPERTIGKKCRRRSNQYRVHATRRSHIKVHPFPEYTIMAWKTSGLATL